MEMKTEEYLNRLNMQLFEMAQEMRISLCLNAVQISASVVLEDGASVGLFAGSGSSYERVALSREHTIREEERTRMDVRA